MAFTVVQSASLSSSGSQASVTTAGIDTTSGNLLVAIPIDFANGIGATPITDSLGNTWTQGIASTGNTRGWSALYYCNNATGGAGHTFTFTPTGSSFLALVVLEIRGQATSSVLGSTATDVTSTANHNSGSITATGVVDQIFIGCCSISASGSATVSDPSWWTRTANGTASAEGYIFGWKEVGAGESDDFAATTSFSGRETILIAGFLSDDVGGSPSPGGDEGGSSRARVQRRM